MLSSSRLSSEVRAVNVSNRLEKSHLQEFVEAAKDVREEILGIVKNVNEPIAQGKEQLSTLASKFKEEEPQQLNMKSAEQLLEMGEAVSINFHTMMEYIAHQTHAEHKRVPLKTAERIRQKAEGKYKDSGDYGAIRDVLRTSFTFNQLEDLYRAVNEIHGLLKIVHIEDSFDEPKKSGYMDLKLIVEFEGPNSEPFLSEIQMHLKALIPAQKEERKLYELRRNAEDQLDSLSPDDIKREALERYIKNLERQGKKGYQMAAKRYLIGKRKFAA